MWHCFCPNHRKFLSSSHCSSQKSAEFMETSRSLSIFLIYIYIYTEIFVHLFLLGHLLVLSIPLAVSTVCLTLTKMAMRVCVTLVFAMVQSAHAQPTGITQTEWTTTIDRAGAQRMLSQRMSKEFLLVAKGVNSTVNRHPVLKTMCSPAFITHVYILICWWNVIPRAYSIVTVYSH